LKYFDDAYLKDSTDVMPVFAKGEFYQHRNEDAKAKEEYKKCILRNGRYMQAYFNMGYLLMQEDSFDKSFRQYDIATKISPLNAAAYFNRGLCNEMLNKPKEALADYRQSHQLDTTYDKPKEALKRLGVK
jgi:tetratricopeptide (TPR) repeat protein